MNYVPEKWVPRQDPVEAFLIQLETVDELKTLLGATSAKAAYSRGNVILIEWTMMHREIFGGLVGQYVVRDIRGNFEVLDFAELLLKYEPFMEKVDIPDKLNGEEELGKLLAVASTDGNVEEILFELPDGTPATFVRKTETSVDKKDEVLEEPEEVVEADKEIVKKAEKSAAYGAPAGTPAPKPGSFNK